MSDYVLGLAQDVMLISVILSGPFLFVSLGVGVLVSIFQAATQINEVTLTFVPKIISMGIVLFVLGSWMIQQMLEFTINIFNSMSNLPYH